MALQNSDGVYLKIQRVNLPHDVVVEKYRNHEIRSKGASEFDTVVHDGFYVPGLKDFTDEMADSKKSIKNNLITAGYKALKELAEFKDWNDV